MKIGMQLHPDRGADAVIEEARRADEQGYDSVWLSDHLIGLAATQGPDGPLDYFTLMVAIGAVTKRTRLAWGTLNPSFRNPALFAKMLSSLDVITHGRVICTIGAGWLQEEYKAYGLPFIEDHDERVEHEREVVQLMKELWTHPAPERVTFLGKYAQANNLPFSPAPFQKPHPPVWIGGDSDATLNLVRELADGWMMLRAGNPKTLGELRSAPDWPARPLTLVRGGHLYVAETREAAVGAAAAQYEVLRPTRIGAGLGTLEEFLAREIVGTPDDCLQRIAEMESWGVNYLRLNIRDEAHQEQVARLILPKLP